MEPWILITIVAATAQAVRFMLQKHLKGTKLSTAGATFSRFIYSAPLIALIAATYGWTTGQGLPYFASDFLSYATVGGVAQILATMCVVALFAHRNFAVGITFMKTEVLLSAVIGFVVLGDLISWTALAAILIGFAGLLLLSDSPTGSGAISERVFNRATALGIMSGLLFGVSAVAYRGASLALPDGDVFYRAIVTLAFVTAFQVAIMSIWMALKERGEIMRVFAAWRVAGLVGLTSMIGSIGWFTAFTLQTAALVKAVGQIELIFSILATTFIFKETISKREFIGMALLAFSILALILLG